jgi:hypothetical protein
MTISISPHFSDTPDDDKDAEPLEVAMVHANPNENAVNPIDKSIQLHNDKIDEGT